MSGLDKICGATSGVIIVTILDFQEVVFQVHGYLIGVVDLEHQAHCKLLYSVVYPEPPHSFEMTRVKMSPRWKVEQEPNQFVL